MQQQWPSSAFKQVRDGRDSRGPMTGDIHHTHEAHVALSNIFKASMKMATQILP